jgi:hypothetical protein
MEQPRVGDTNQQNGDSHSEFPMIRAPEFYPSFGADSGCKNAFIP